MKKDYKIFFKHILESIEHVDFYLDSLNKRGFMQSIQVQDAVIRRLEVIGEAVKKLPLSVKNKAGDFPWREVAGMRDVLIHDYFGVDLSLVWVAATKRLSELKKVILFLSEEHAVDAVLKAEKEIKGGKILKGDLDDLADKL